MGSQDISVIDGLLTNAAELRSGLHALVPGVLGVTELQVVQRTAGANNSVDVLRGRAVVQSPLLSQPDFHCPNYLLSNEVDVNSASISAFPLGNFTAPHATYTRLDQVILRVYDNESGFRKWQLEVITGFTPTQDATLDNRHNAGASPTGVPFLHIADVLVPTSGIISTAGIRDYRPWAHRDDVPGNGKTQYAPTAPAGYLMCDGSAIPRNKYAALFARISTTYGVGDGTNTFNLPDARGRGLVMPDGGAGRLTAAKGHTTTLGATAGAETHKLIAAEGSVPDDGATDAAATGVTIDFNGAGNNHVLTDSGPTAYGRTGDDPGLPEAGGITRTALSIDDPTHGHSLVAKDAANEHENVQPYLAAFEMIYSGMAT